jgi:hypothetical protein
MSLIPVILPTTVAAPTFASILTSQDTYLNSLTPLSVVGSGGGSNYPVNAAFNTITVADQLNVGEGGNIVMVNDPTNLSLPAGIVFPRDANPAGLFGSVLVYDNLQSTLGVLDFTDGSYSVGALSLAALKGLSSINGVSYTGGGGTVPPDLTLSTLNVSTITNSGILTGTFSTVSVTTDGNSDNFCPWTYSIYPSTFVIHPPGNATYFGVDNTQTYVKGVDFNLYQNGLSAYNPRIVFNSGAGTAIIEANTSTSPSGVVIQSTLTTSAFSVSSINNVPPFTLAQYEALSTLAA